MKIQFKQQLLFALSSILIMSIVVACGNGKHVNNEQKKLKKVNDKELVKALFKQKTIPYHFLTTRIGVDLKSTKQQASFSCYIKHNVDTAFGGSIKVGPVFLATYKGTQDSIIFLNKREKCYFAENLNYISTLFGTTVEFDFFQELILGLPIGLNEETKYQQIDNKDHYILSSHKKRDFKKLEQDKFEIKNEDSTLVMYHLDTTNLSIFQVDIEVPSDTTSITIKYLETKLEDGFLVPEKTTLSIVSPNDTVFIEMKYGSVKLNEPKSINIKIPDSYIACP